MVCDKNGVWKRVCDKDVCERGGVTKMCVKEEAAEGGGGRCGGGGGIENQKQEPHTMMWGTKRTKTWRLV